MMRFAGWPWRRPRVGLAFADGFLLAHRAGSDPRTVRRDLAPGLLTPSVSTPNIQSVRDVATLAAEMLEELSARRTMVSIVLPDLSVVTIFSSSSSADGSNRPGASDARLGFPATEARRDSWRGKHGEEIVAYVRESVVRQFEQVVEAAECDVGWVDGASLVRIPAWTERSQTETRLTVRVQLYRSHYVVSAFRAGELLDVRTRLRTPSDADRVAEELARAPSIYDVAAIGPLTLSGEDADVCVRSLSGLEVANVSAADSGEERQLMAALEGLLERGRA